MRISDWSSDVCSSDLRAVQLLGMAWTLPNTVAGLLLGLIGLPFGAHMHARGRELAIVFHRWPWGPGGAITLGNVILHTGDSLDSPCKTYAHIEGPGDEPPIVLDDHERAHVNQHIVVAPSFLPLYSFFGVLITRPPLHSPAAPP